MGCLVLIVFVVFIWLLAAHPPWAVLLLFAVVWLVDRHNQVKTRERQSRLRLHQEAQLGWQIARRQREIAASDAELGLASAYLSAVNADTLTHLANPPRPSHTGQPRPVKGTPPWPQRSTLSTSAPRKTARFAGSSSAARNSSQVRYRNWRQ